MRIRALDALDQGTPRSEVIRLFGVSTATLTRWRRRQRETGYIIHRLAPTLQADQIVVVDNLKVHSSDRAKAAIEAKGAQLSYLPTYSPDLTSIEEAFSKFKAALRTSGPRTVEAHSTAVWAALRTITPQDAAGWIAHAGYGTSPRPKRPARQRALPGVLFRFPDPHPAVVLPVPTSTAFDHLW